MGGRGGKGKGEAMWEKKLAGRREGGGRGERGGGGGGGGEGGGDLWDSIGNVNEINTQ